MTTHPVVWLCPTCKLPVSLSVPIEIEDRRLIVNVAPAVWAHLAQHRR